MTIQFKCSACQAPLRAPDEMAGRRAKCRQCGGAVAVPAPEADLWPPGMAPPPSAPAQPPVQRLAAKAQPTAPARPAAAKAQPITPAPRKKSAPATPPTAAPIAQAMPVQPAKTSAPAVPQTVPVAPVAPVTAQPAQAVPAAIAVPQSHDTDPPRAQSTGESVDHTPMDDLAALLDLEQSAPRPALRRSMSIRTRRRRPRLAPSPIAPATAPTSNEFPTLIRCARPGQSSSQTSVHCWVPRSRRRWPGSSSMAPCLAS